MRRRWLVQRTSCSASGECRGDGIPWSDELLSNPRRVLHRVRGVRRHPRGPQRWHVGAGLAPLFHDRAYGCTGVRVERPGVAARSVRPLGCHSVARRERDRPHGVGAWELLVLRESSSTVWARADSPVPVPLQPCRAPTVAAGPDPVSQLRRVAVVARSSCLWCRGDDDAGVGRHRTSGQLLVPHRSRDRRPGKRSALGCREP